MPGIYLHIPFCKQACHYCDFHFSTSLKHIDAMQAALLREIQLRKSYLAEEKIASIYFGGGTPSLFPATYIRDLIREIEKHFELDSDLEITLEANPDDIDQKSLAAWIAAGVNRLSIGVQSFVDRDLQWMNRAHQANQAIDCIRRAQDMGIENISIDLIYGTPNLTDKEWIYNLSKAFELGVPHISSYALTVEGNTALGNWVNKGKMPAMDEEQAANQFEILMDEMQNAGFEHYEISNFCKPGFESKHNSSYWEGKKYLGIGPAAHSFNKESRSWNPRNNHAYIDALMRDTSPLETEILSLENRINEYLMVTLRTSKGIDANYYEQEFGSENWGILLEKMQAHISAGNINAEHPRYFCSNKGKLFADAIASELFNTETHDH